MEAPADVESGSVSDWRRSPAKPVTGLTGTPPLPWKAITCRTCRAPPERSRQGVSPRQRALSVTSDIYVGQNDRSALTGRAS